MPGDKSPTSPPRSGPDYELEFSIFKTITLIKLLTKDYFFIKILNSVTIYFRKI